ncbi:hypothetical protein MTO96_002006 [Rhipicephalus appendiculatus]
MYGLAWHREPAANACLGEGSDDASDMTAGDAGDTEEGDSGMQDVSVRSRPPRSFPLSLHEAIWLDGLNVTAREKKKATNAGNHDGRLRSAVSAAVAACTSSEEQPRQSRSSLRRCPPLLVSTLRRALFFLSPQLCTQTLSSDVAFSYSYLNSSIYLLPSCRRESEPAGLPSEQADAPV